MKYFYVILLAVLISGCKKVQYVEFLGSTPGIDSGSFSVKTISGVVLFNANIRSGKFYEKKKFDIPPGYYILTISKNGMGTVGSFDVYIEDGTYKITAIRDKPYKYPDIRSTSKKENELAAYYHLSDSVSTELIKKVTQLTSQVNSPEFKLQTPTASASLLNQLKDAKANETSAPLIGIAAFVAKYPDNEIASRIMLNMNYQSDPEAYYKLYKKFSPTDTNSAAGKELGHWLRYYMAQPIGK